MSAYPWQSQAPRVTIWTAIAIVVFVFVYDCVGDAIKTARAFEARCAEKGGVVIRGKGVTTTCIVGEYFQ